MPEPDGPATYPVRDALDAFDPRRAVRGLAARLGFPRVACQEIEIVVSELCSNIVKHGVRGSIELARVDDPELGVGISIVASDEGRPIHDLSLAIQDGWDDRGPIDPVLLLRRGGLGAGLGAVVRLTDTFEMDQHKSGKQIAVVRYLRRPKKRPLSMRPPRHRRVKR